MRIAFYAPLKPPDHPVPSGDRQMSRLLIDALRLAGHEVEVASALRAFLPQPHSSAVSALEGQARAEVARLENLWTSSGAPDMWFCYHPYYKAPDLIGPDLVRRFAIPYVTAEASHAGRRDREGWGPVQAKVIAAVSLACVNLCFTGRDREGLARAVPHATLADVKPFIDTAPFTAGPEPPARSPVRLVAVAMMRRGDKLRSFAMLASALALIAELPWHLTVVGDGPERSEVKALFRHVGSDRISWTGEIPPHDVGRYLYDGDLYVWPGSGEAYGLAYLEAQAAGLPVIAQKTAGVPEVVEDGVTGILTDEGDPAAFGSAIRILLTDATRRRSMAAAARRFVHEQRSLTIASAKIDTILAERIPR